MYKQPRGNKNQIKKNNHKSIKNKNNKNIKSSKHSLFPFIIKKLNNLLKYNLV